MHNLVSSVSARAEDLPLRPLLFAVGAAATAVGVYCCVKRGDGKKTTADPENTTSPEDPVCDQNIEPVLVQTAEVLQDQMKEDVTEDEAKIQKLLVFVTQLEDRVKELEELLCATCREDSDHKQDAYHIFENEFDEQKNLSGNEESQKVSLHETEEKHQKALETIAQLKKERSDLTDQVKTLQDTVEDMEDSFIETNMECDELMNAYSLLQEENDELKKTLIQSEKLQKDSLAEAAEKHQKAVDTISQLEEEKSDLTNQVKALRKILQEIEDRLIQTNLECDELMKEHERERKAYSILQEEYSELKKTLIHCEELRKNALVEAEEKHRKAVEIIAQLKVEKCDLTNQMKTLRDTVQDMKGRFVDTNLECKELRNYYKQERDAYSILHEEYRELEFQNEELQKVTLEKHQKAVEIIAQLEKERSNLTTQVKSLRDTVHNMGKQLFETNVEFDELMNEHEEEQEAYGILQKRYDGLKKTLVYNEELQKEAEEKHQKAMETISELEKEKSDLVNQVKTLGDTVQYMGNQLVETHSQYDELMNISLTEADEKHQEALETIAELKAERTELTNQVKTLRDKMKDITFLICVTQKQCEQLTEKFERQREAHSRLYDENEELKKTLMHTEKSLKVSLSEAVEKHQKAVETITQLEAERSELTNQLVTLRVTVQDMGNKISETNRESDNLTGLRDQEQEAHRVLQSEHQVTKEKLKCSEQLLKSNKYPKSKEERNMNGCGSSSKST